MVSARSIRRIPEENRWSRDNLIWISSAPWKRYKGADDADGDIPEGVPGEELLDRSEGPEDKIIFIETKSKAPREFQISKADVEK